MAIGQAWLDREDCPTVLESHAARGFVRGVRHKPKPGQMDDPRWRAGFARLAPLGLHFELQAPYAQMSEAARLARDFPGTTIVVNHAGLPPATERSAWRAFDDITHGFSHPERRALFHDNALRIYRMQ